MIRLYPLTNLNYNIFDNPDYLLILKEYDIVMTNSMEKADVFIARRLDPQTFILVDEFIKRKKATMKPVLLWTHEPRFCKTDEDVITNLISVPVYVMNMYTNNVYFSNFTIYGSRISWPLSPINTVSYSEIPICALASYVHEERQAFVLHGKNIDLTVKRQNLMLEGYKRGIVNVYGKGWPNGISRSSSGGANRVTEKMRILKQHQFNICLENTGYPYYCTEKIWESLKGYCLPIYSSFNNKIYDTFPKGSFIDVEDYANADNLFSAITEMTPAEYIERMNVCINIYNNLRDAIDMNAEIRMTLHAIAAKLYDITGKKSIKYFKNTS